MHIAYMTNDRSEYRRGTASILMTRDKFDLKVFAAKALQMSGAYISFMHACGVCRHSSIPLPPPLHKQTGVYMTAVQDFRAIRRTLPKRAIFNLRYEDWLQEDGRLRLLGRLVDFLGAAASGVCLGWGE